jgi:hypothetical protein
VTTQAAARWFPSDDDAPEVRFACRLGEQPGHAVPRRLLAGLVGAAPDAAPAASLRVGEAAQLLGSDRVAPGPLAVAADPYRGALPWWLDAPSAAAVAAVRTGGAVPPAWRALLGAAGIVGDERRIRMERERAEGLVAGAAARFATDGYVALPGVLHPFHLGALRVHVRRLARLGHMADGDGQTPLRWTSHDDPGLRVFHHALTALVSAVGGEPLKPSYVYTATYHDGADLPRHTDRVQCGYTLSVCLDCLPEPHREVPWPLRLHTPTTRVDVHQALGDGLLFTGVDVPHERPRLPPGLTVSAAFMHYVPAAFDGPLQ